MNLKGCLCIFLLINLITMSILTIPPNASADPDQEDILIGGSETLPIQEATSCKNITIRDEGTLIVEDTYLEINGVLRMSDNARFFIIQSTVELNPPPLDDSIHVLYATDNATISVIEGSNLILNPQLTPTNTSYMLMEDNSKFFLMDSIFYGEQPSIINQSIEVASVTAGVYLLSGQASWFIKNSDVYGRISIEGGELTGRWFWCSLHQSSTLTIEDSDIQLISTSSGYTLLKPVSGVTTIKNSRILDGTIECEVAAELEFKDSIFSHKVEFKDQSIAKVANCTFHESVTVGSALSIIKADWNPESQVEFYNSTFLKKLRCEGNSSTSINKSTLWGLNIRENASVGVYNCIIEADVSIRDHSQAEIENSSLGNVIMDDTSLAIIDYCQDISSIFFYGSGEGREEKTISLRETNVDIIDMDSNFTGAISLENVGIENIGFKYDANAIFECINSSVDNLISRRTGRNVTLNFIVINSTLPDFTGIERNITVLILYRLYVLIELNDMPVETEIEVDDDFGREWRGKSFSGSIYFDLPYKLIHNETVNITENYEVTASYLGFSEIKNLILNSSKTVIFDWSDETPPIITNISYEPKQWNLGKEITVKAEIKDYGVISINTAILFYKLDNEEWSEVTMFKTGEDRYEATIPKHDNAGKITFYIKAEDMAGNAVNSNMQYIEIGQEENALYLGGFVLLISLILVMVLWKIVIYRKIKKYKDKYESKSGGE